ncbi:MAG: DNA (cytosine-5-)-methyltransferase [Candidatus Sumerlaeia bacterium]
MKTIKFVDLFCGIGGFRYAVEGVAKKIGIKVKCLLSSDIDLDCQKEYEANFGEKPTGDIHAIADESIPEHDVLLAGFPCQPFSIIGKRKGFEDARGTLFFEVARIVQAKRPQAVVLENVKLLAGHNGGKTLSRILEVLTDLGYKTDYKILNALDFGLPQKRERIFIVAFKSACDFEWPKGGLVMKPLGKILEKNVPSHYFASEYIKGKRFSHHQPTTEPTIWHENKAGHISVYPYSCALRAGASYNYLLVNGERRLTPREMLRLQGFPDTFKIVCNYGQIRKQAGNSLPVPVAGAVLENVFAACGWVNGNSYCSINQSFDGQTVLFEKEVSYAKRAKIKNGRKV